MSLLKTVARDTYRTSIEHAAGGHVSWRLPHGGGVALTFDDGPDPVQTPRILDCLAEFGARATFFVLGDHADRYPELIRRIAAEGHLVGNHTYAHFHCPELDLAGLMRQLERTDAAIDAALGTQRPQAPYLFRPPFGELQLRQAVYLALRGRSVAFWTRDSLDYRDASTEEIAATAVTMRPRDVLLMHDRFPNTVEALPMVLETLQRRELRIVRLDDVPAAPHRRTAHGGRASAT